MRLSSTTLLQPPLPWYLLPRATTRSRGAHRPNGRAPLHLLRRGTSAALRHSNIKSPPQWAMLLPSPGNLTVNPGSPSTRLVAPRWQWSCCLSHVGRGDRLEGTSCTTRWLRLARPCWQLGWGRGPESAQCTVLFLSNFYFSLNIPIIRSNF
jgi:hypothetical protein